MNIILKSVSFLLFISIISFPFLLIFGLKKYRKKAILIPYLLFSILISGILILLFAWWSDYSNETLLSHYGYNFDAMNEIEEYENVASENLEHVKQLNISRMGIGWPLKAMMAYTFYLPYLLVIYLFYCLFSKFKNLNSN